MKRKVRRIIKECISKENDIKSILKYYTTAEDNTNKVKKLYKYISCLDGLNVKGRSLLQVEME